MADARQAAAFGLVRKRYEERVSRRLREREALAREVAAEAARVLLQDFGARHVWLIGSLGRGTFGPQSDVDLLVEGLKPELYLRALGRLLSLNPNIQVDLIPLEETSAPFRALAEKERVNLP